MCDLTIEALEGPADGLDVSGDLDYNSAAQLRERIATLFSSGCRDLRLRLDGVEFVDSTGLAVMLEAVKRARASGGAVTLVRPSRQLMRILTVSGFAPFFSFDPAPPQPQSELARDLAGGNGAGDDSLLTELFEAEGLPESIGALRRSVVRFAESLPFSRQDLEDIKLAVGEASCNALRYGCPTGGESIRVICTRKGRRFSVQIIDPGPGFNPDAVPQVSEGDLSEGGRGIFFMHLLMDEVSFDFSHGTTVELVKYLPEDGHSSGRGI